MKNLRDVIIEKQDELIVLLIKGYSSTNIVLKNLYKEIIFLKQQLKLKLFEQPEVSADSKYKEDLKQYITNLLYYAHIEANNLTSFEFDKWVEENINLLEDYTSQVHHP